MTTQGLLEVRLGNPAHGGYCVARHEGRVVFVRHGLPGELVRVAVTEDRGGSFCRGDAVEVLEASPDRVPRLCRVAGPHGAGCCDLSHADADAARSIKAAVVAEQLHRLARIDTEVVVEPLCGMRTGWRTRVALPVDAQGRAGLHRYRSVDVLAEPMCAQPAAQVLDGLAQHRWRPGAELRVALDDAGVRHVVEVDPSPMAGNARRTGRRGAVVRRGAAVKPRGSRVLQGSGRARYEIAGRVWEVSASSFWQPHREAARRYSDVIAQYADLSPGDTAWDLYSGAGIFAAQLADRVGFGGRVLAAESAHDAVDDGIRALTDLPQVEFRAVRVERLLADPVDSCPAPATVVLDPPRAGVPAVVVAAVTRVRPRRIIHIGCDPAAFARDIARYGEHGYRMQQLRVFDAFPLTHHVECIAVLDPAR